MQSTNPANLVLRDFFLAWAPPKTGKGPWEGDCNQAYLLPPTAARMLGACMLARPLAFQDWLYSYGRPQVEGFTAALVIHRVSNLAIFVLRRV